MKLSTYLLLGAAAADGAYATAGVAGGYYAEVRITRLEACILS